MATLSITKSYADATLLSESDLDSLNSSIETFLNTTKISDDNIQTAGITASLKLQTASVTTAKIADSNITTAKIADEAVTTAKIADSNITTAKIASSAVTTAKIADAAISYAKLSRSYVRSSSSGSSGTTTADIISVNGGSYAALTNLSATINTSGNPVIVHVGPANDGTEALYYPSGGVFYACVFRDSTPISGDINTSSQPVGANAGNGFFSFDAVAEGTYTYTVRAAYLSSSANFKCTNLVLTLVEL